MKCKLKDLDGTKSHVITESILRSGFSEEGTKGRNHEMIFSLGDDSLGDSLYGIEDFPIMLQIES